MTDLYQILGVKRGATDAEIKSAYRKLARKCHPDVSASPDASAQFTRIHQAYYVLSDRRRRAAYDHGAYADPSGAAYAARAVQVVAMQRQFDRMVDEMLAAERQAAAERSHAVLLVVPFFLSSFYVMAAKPMIIQELNFVGRALVVALAVLGAVYLVKNLAIVLARYTYKVPDHMISMFREEEPHDKFISRKAGLVFLVSGYLVSLGLGHVVSNFLPLRLGSALSLGALIGVLLYPPIAVLIIGSIRRLGSLLERY